MKLKITQATLSPEANNALQSILASSQQWSDEMTRLNSTVDAAASKFLAKPSLLDTALKFGPIAKLGISAAKQVFDVLSNQYMLHAEAEQQTLQLSEELGSRGAAHSRMNEYYEVAQAAAVPLNQVVEVGKKLQEAGQYSKQNLLAAIGNQAQTAQGRVNQFNNSLQQLQTNIGGSLASSFNDTLSCTSGIIDKFNEWMAIPVTQTIAEEKVQLNSLVGAITDVNTSVESRSRLLQELQNKYPDFLKNMDIETVKNDELKTRLKEVNAEYREKVKLASMKEAANKEDKKLHEFQDEHTRLSMYQQTEAQIKDIESWFKTNTGITTTKPVQNLLGTHVYQVLRIPKKQVEQMEQRLAANPNDREADEFITHYQDYMSAIDERFDLIKWYESLDEIPQKITELEQQMRTTQRRSNMYNLNALQQQGKMVLQQANGFDISSPNTYEQLFGKDTKTAAKLADEFVKLRSTALEKLQENDFKRLQEFVNGDLAKEAITTTTATKRQAYTSSATNSLLERQYETVSTSGNVKNIVINLDSLIGVNNNTFAAGQSPEEAENFTNKLTTLLQSVLNDVNYTN